MPNIYFIKSCQQSYFLWILLVQNKFSMGFNKQVVATHHIASHLTAKFPRKWTPKFFISHTTVTLNDGQGHTNWYQNAEPSSLYHHTKFQRYRSVNVSIPANVKAFSNDLSSYLLWVLNRQDKMNMRFIRPTNLNSRSNSIQTDWKLCEIIGKVFAFSHTSDLESRSRSIRQVSKCRVQQYLSAYQVCIHKCMNACQC